MGPSYHEEGAAYRRPQVVARGASSEVDPWVASSVGGWVAYQGEEVEWGSAACVGAASLGAAGEASYPALNLEDPVETACPSLVDLQEALGFLRRD